MIKWTKEKLQEEANKYKTRRDLQKNNNAAYKAACQYKVINDIFKNHENNGYSKKQRKNGYWTLEKLQEEANKYKNRNDFRENKAAYGAAKRKKLLNIIFKNHKNKGYLHNNWDTYVIYAYELINYNKAYVGLTNNIKKRDTYHLFNKKEKLNIFCKKNNIPYPKYKILEKNISGSNVKEREKYWLKYYKNRGWEMFNIAKAGSLGNLGKKWTKKSLQKEANKYKNRNDFVKNNNSAYNIACRKNLLNDLFKNHKNKGYHIYKPVKWNKEKLQEKANKYETINEFMKKEHGAYQSAIKYNLLKDIFKNHKNKGYIRKKSQLK